MRSCRTQQGGELDRVKDVLGEEEGAALVFLSHEGDDWGTQNDDNAQGVYAFLSPRE